jgi:hypothetical protein
MLRRRQFACEPIDGCVPGGRRLVKRAVPTGHPPRDPHNLRCRGVELPGEPGDAVVSGTAFAASQVVGYAPDCERQHLLCIAGAEAHHRPGTKDILLDRTADRPHGVGREPDSSFRIETPNRLDKPERPLLDQIAHRQAPASIAPGDLDHVPQVTGHQPMKGFTVPSLGAPSEFRFFVAIEQRMPRRLLDERVALA